MRDKVRVLVTTWITKPGRGVAVHTIVLEFEGRQDARHAADVINEASDDETEFNQRATLLFQGA